MQKSDSSELFVLVGQDNVYVDALAEQAQPPAIPLMLFIIKMRHLTGGAHDSQLAGLELILV